MCGHLDDGAGVVAAVVPRNLRGAIDDADGRRIGEQGDRPPHVRVGHRVVIAVEDDVRLLPGAHRPHERGLEGMRRQREQHALLLDQDLRHRLVALVGMAPLMGDRVAPLDKLRMQVVEVAEGPGGEEGVAQVLDLPLDLALLIGARGRARTGREVIVAGQLQQARMKVDRAALAIEHRGFQIVVLDRARAAAQRGEGLDMPAQEALERLIEREDRVDRARVAEHQHEGRQRADAAADADRAEAAPVDLGDFPRQRRQAEIRLGRRRGPQRAHRATDLHRRARIAALAQHLVQARRPQARILRQRVAHEGQIRVERGGPAAPGLREHTRAIERRCDRLMVDAELGGDGADAPVLGVVEAANLGVLRGRDHHGAPGTRDGSARAVEGAICSDGHRPCIATPPSEGRSAPDPSTCRPAVWRRAAQPGKCDPSRGPDRRAGDRDGPDGLRGWRDGGDGPPAPRRGARPSGTSRSNTRGRDRTRRRSRTAGYSADRS